MNDVVAGKLPANEFMGHPRGLVILFFTEAWERFSYYGMRALLIFYLTQHFLFSDQQSVTIYASYISLVYLTPVLGGVIADRYLGQRKAVTLGAILLVLGHFGMAFEGEPATRVVELGQTEIVRDAFYLQAFYFSLALIITGVGFLKANISTIVGALYEENDPRRDGGFTIFYMGINLGAFIAPLICGYLGMTYGWAYGFGLAGVGMLFGLLIFLRWQYLLEGKAEPHNPEYLTEKTFVRLSRETLVYLFALVMVVVCWQLVQNNQVIGGLLGFTGALMIAVIMFFAFTKCSPVERDRLLVLTFLMFYQVLFWGLFEQIGGSLNLMADRNVEREVAGFVIPAPWFQSVNSLFIITLAPLFSLLWVYLSKRGWEPSTPMKFALGLLQLGAGFLVLVYGVEHFSTPEGKFNMIWLILLILLHTTGELCISPVGLSATTTLSVAKIGGMMMGCFFLSLAAGNFVSGIIGGMASSDTEISSVAGYMEVFEFVGLLTLGAAVIGVLIVPFLKKYMHGIH